MCASGVDGAPPPCPDAEAGSDAPPGIRGYREHMSETITRDAFVPEAGGVTMFTTTWCGYCARLKNQMTKAGVPFREVDIETTPGTAELVAEVNGGNQTVPTLVFPDGSTATNPSLAEVQSRV
jgi:mycoredoxin